MKQTIDKALFYDRLKPFAANKHLPIKIDMPIRPDNYRYRLIYNWSSRKPNGDYQPIMTAQLIDTTKQGWKKYVVPDLTFDGLKEGVTTDYKLWKYLNAWAEAAIGGGGDGSN